MREKWSECSMKDMAPVALQLSLRVLPTIKTELRRKYDTCFQNTVQVWRRKARRCGHSCRGRKLKKHPKGSSPKSLFPFHRKKTYHLKKFLTNSKIMTMCRRFTRTVDK